MRREPARRLLRRARRRAPSRVRSGSGTRHAPGRSSGSVRDRPAAWRFPDHHAPQHAERLGGVVHADEAAGAEPTQLILRGLARALDRVPVDGGADLGESTAFADDEARERWFGVQASASRRPSASIRAPTSRPSSAARSTSRMNRPMRVRDCAGEKVGLGRNEPYLRAPQSAALWVAAL